MKLSVTTLLLFCFFGAFAQPDYLMLVGTYTSGGSEGIYVYNFNAATAESRVLDSAKISNPSYLTLSPNQKFVYAVSEDGNDRSSGGKIASFSLNNQTGAIRELNRQPSKGDNPCYIATDKAGKWAIAGNYSSGNLAVLPILKNGYIDTAVTTVQHTGQSVNTDRQNEPHVHATVLSPDNRFLFVPDLGIDKLMVYKFDKRRGTLREADAPFVMTKPGSGPRHFVFHPNKKYAYLVEELTGSVSAYEYRSKNGELRLLQNISTLPPEFMGSIGSADIHVSPDGNFLYASNRGTSNSIAIFKLDQKTGLLTVAGHQSTLGRTPRNFNFDPSGNFLLVANQETDDIVIFKIDRSTGLLNDTGKRINVSKPVCIKWANKKK